MEQRTYRCEYCGYSTGDRLEMVKHMLTHTSLEEEIGQVAGYEQDYRQRQETSPAFYTEDKPVYMPERDTAYRAPVTTESQLPRVSLSRDDLQAGLRMINIRAGLLWQDEHFLRNLIYENAGLKNGDRVLLLCEDNEACRFPREIKQIIGDTGELVDIDFNLAA